MSIADPRTILRVAGRLCKDPTDLLADFPHGGTALGLIASAEFTPVMTRAEIRAEEYGGEIVEVVEQAERVVFACVARGYDSDMLATLFRDTATGGGTGGIVVTNDSTRRGGELGSDSAVKLLYSPKDTEQHPALLLYRTIPLTDPTIQMQMSIGEELGIAAVFTGIRDATDRIYQWGRLEDLTL